MNSTKRLAASMAGAVAIAALVGTSAFAESRHSDATNERREQRGERSSENRDHGRGQSDRRGGDSNRTPADSYRNNDHGNSQNNTYRDSNRGRSQNDAYRNNNDAYRNNRGTSQPDAYRNNNEAYRNNRGAGQYDAYRNNGNRAEHDSYRNERGRSENQGYRNGGSQNYGSRNNRPDYDDRGRRNTSIGGRINRFLHESGGYRIWVDGGRYPIWIPEARIGLFPRLRVGLSVNFGGYYDPLGYVEAYDYYDGAGYGYGGSYASGLLRGVVETVDYRRGTLVLRDENSGNFVTALIRDRRLESLRPGDYAEISGDWTRGGVFEALRLENVDGGRY